MYSSIETAVICGIESIPVRVEADVSEGMPQFEMVGYLSGEVREARERVRTALNNAGFHLPPKKITINLTPANIRKSGNGCDLPVAAAILAALGHVDGKALEGYLVLGEVGLDGSVLPVGGALSAAVLASEKGMKGMILPAPNAGEAALFPDIPVYPAETIQDLVSLSRAGFPGEGAAPLVQSPPPSYGVDFSEIRGQPLARLAAEIAASGMHNLLLLGPPGSGKSMIAKRMSTILPPLSGEERLEVSKIYSVYGLPGDRQGIRTERPFRAPHHTVTMQALAGGGAVPRPGEISLAHRGVLFLDELTEFDNRVLEALREPLEDKRICISRVDQSFVYPADFLLLAAMNPCKCGYYPDMNRCTCTPASLRRYVNRISRPLLDRIDLCVQMTELSCHDIWKDRPAESSAGIRDRVEAVQKRQQERFRNCPYYFNSQIPARDMDTFCKTDPKVRRLLEDSFRDRKLTARSYHKLLRVARTIADMDQSEEIAALHLKKAMLFRGLDEHYWRMS